MTLRTGDMGNTWTYYGGFVEKADRLLAKKVKLPAGYTFKMIGRIYLAHLSVISCETPLWQVSHLPLRLLSQTLALSGD